MHASSLGLCRPCRHSPRFKSRTGPASSSGDGLVAHVDPHRVLSALPGVSTGLEVRRNLTTGLHCRCPATVTLRPRHRSSEEEQIE